MGNPTLDRINLQRQAQAIKEKRIREGTWKGSVEPHTAYQTKPIEWIVKYLGIKEDTIRWSQLPEYDGWRWDGDRDPFARMLEAIANDGDVGMESGTGTGKTLFAACIALWYIAVFRNAIVVSAAPKQDQLLLHMWKEIGKLWPRFQKAFPEAKLLTGKIRMLPGEEEKELWSATAFVAGVGADEEAATKAQGFHGERMLWITEETPGMPAPIMKSIRNTRTGTHNPHLALGNPDHRNDELHRFCTRPWTKHLRISALDHPNIVVNARRDPMWHKYLAGEVGADALDLQNDVEVVPGAVSRKKIVERREEYGEGDRLYQSRVRGISPAEAESAIIKWDWCIAAAQRYNDPFFREGLPALGVDVANSESGDEAAVATGLGACLLEIDSFPCNDANELGRKVSRLMDANDPPILPRYVGVDADGVGAGSVNELKRLRKRVHAIHNSGKGYRKTDPADTYREEDTPTVIGEEIYKNKRASMWWRLRQDLQQGRIALPWDEELFQDLTTPMKLPGDVIQVEGKDDIRKRLGRSPNKGDAAVYWNFVRSRRRIVHHEEPEVDPNEDTFFDEHMERLVAAHDPDHGRRKKLKRNMNSVRRRDAA